jgi:hypothetical protein
MNIDEAFQAPLGGASWEKTDNPCAFTASVHAFVSPAPKRHQIGLVGGNEVSEIKGDKTDLESDLRGITRINTFAPWKAYQPTAQGGTINRDNWKGSVRINTAPRHLEEMQMQAMPAVYAPAPIRTDNCREKHKF